MLSVDPDHSARGLTSGRRRAAVRAVVRAEAPWQGPQGMLAHCPRDNFESGALGRGG